MTLLLLSSYLKISGNNCPVLITVTSLITDILGISMILLWLKGLGKLTAAAEVVNIKVIKL